MARKRNTQEKKESTSYYLRVKVKKFIEQLAAKESRTASNLIDKTFGDMM